MSKKRLKDAIHFLITFIFFFFGRKTIKKNTHKKNTSSGFPVESALCLY